MKAVSIFGSPGTGKSTRLISIIDRLLEKYEPRDLTLVSFTKAASQEMGERCPSTDQHCHRALGLLQVAQPAEVDGG